MQTNFQDIRDSIIQAKITRLVNALPDNETISIYDEYEYEYFIGMNTCNRYLKLLKSKDSQNLKYAHLTEPTRNLLQKPSSIEYLCKKHPVFKKMYIEHYIRKNKPYVLMDTLHSFIASILMTLYH